MRPPCQFWVLPFTDKVAVFTANKTDKPHVVPFALRLAPVTAAASGFLMAIGAVFEGLMTPVQYAMAIIGFSDMVRWVGYLHLCGFDV